MSLKYRSLGGCAAAARGIVASSSTNATPIVLTVTAGHRMKDGDRIGIVGITGNTAADGDFEVYSVGATAASLRGSAGNGTHGGTAIIAALMDQTPFMPKRSAVARIDDAPGGAVLVGTVVLEKADNMKSDLTEFQYTNTSGVATSGFTSALKTGEIAIPAATAGGSLMIEVDLARYMTVRASAYTSGGISAGLLAC